MYSSAEDYGFRTEFRSSHDSAAYAMELYYATLSSYALRQG